MMIGASSIMVYVLKEQIVCLFTNDPSLQHMAISVIWIISFSTFPDGFKGMLKGVIRALGLQAATVYINTVGHWCINLTL